MMQQKSRFYSVVNHSLFLLPLAALALFASTAAFAAVPGPVHDPHQLPTSGEFQKTIETRCTICHTRDQVDSAITGQKDLEALLQRMIERGAILSEKDKRVLGTFWGSPGKAE